MDLHPDIWKRYFTDFISYKLQPGNNDTEVDPQVSSDIAHQLLHSFFNQLNASEPKKRPRLVQLHCHVAIYHINLAQLANLFRPLCKVEEVSVIV